MALHWGVVVVLAAAATASAELKELKELKVTELKASLGQNVSLSCSIQNQNIWWYVEVHDRLLACVGHWTKEDFLQNMVPSTKYQSVEKNQLMVMNILQEDYRRYYCGRRKNDRFSFTDTFHIVSNETAEPHSDDGQASEPQCVYTIWQKESFIYCSLALNAILLTIGFVCIISKCWRWAKCFKVSSSSFVPQENLESLEPPRDTSHFSAASSGQCVYSEVQFSHAMMPCY